MKITQRVKKILANYESDNPGTKGNIARILMTGKLAGTGKMVILPVDQGFEHGPARSFAKNPAGYDPHYHYQLAIDGQAGPVAGSGYPSRAPWSIRGRAQSSLAGSWFLSRTRRHLQSCHIYIDVICFFVTVWI